MNRNSSLPVAHLSWRDNMLQLVLAPVYSPCTRFKHAALGFNWSTLQSGKWTSHFHFTCEPLLLNTRGVVNVTVFIIFSLASLVGVSVCYAPSYVVSSLFEGFPGLVGDSLSAFLHVSFDCFPLCAAFTYSLTLINTNVTTNVHFR